MGWRTDPSKVELMGLFHHVVFSVLTGSNVVDKSVRLMVCCRLRRLRASRGPKTSRA